MSGPTLEGLTTRLRRLERARTREEDGRRAGGEPALHLTPRPQKGGQKGTRRGRVREETASSRTTRARDALLARIADPAEVRAVLRMLVECGGLATTGQTSPLWSLAQTLGITPPALVAAEQVEEDEQAWGRSVPREGVSGDNHLRTGTATVRAG